jgi:hypothetical protein
MNEYSVSVDSESIVPQENEFGIPQERLDRIDRRNMFIYCFNLFLVISIFTIGLFIKQIEEGP